MILINNSLSKPKSNLYEVHSITDKYGLYKLGDKRFSDEDIKHKLEHYYKLMVVRHPLDRYVSATGII